MKVRVAPIAGSVVAHVALLAAVAPLVRTASPAQRSPSPGLRPLSADDATRGDDARTDDLFEVEIVRTLDISDRSVRAPAGRSDPSVRAPAGREADGVRVAASTGHAPDAAGHAPPPPRPGSPYMHMRGPELHLSDADADQILDHPLGPPPEVQRSGRLDNAPGGTAVIPDAVTVVTVEPDGTAHFHDKPNIDIHFHLPIDLDWFRRPDAKLIATKEELGKALRDWYADPEKIARGGHATDLPEHLKAEPGQCDEWGNKMCTPEPMPPPQTVVSGRFDLTAYLMRKLGVGDPFASRKRALLDVTLAERAERGGRFRGEQLERSAELVRRNLERLWAATADPAARREALFEIWDECSEGEGPLGEAGQRARAEVIGWIGAHLPRGSAGAYSDDELAALARRRTSKQPFEPYQAPQGSAFDGHPGVVESDDVGSAGSAR